MPNSSGTVRKIEIYIFISNLSQQKARKDSFSHDLCTFFPVGRGQFFALRPEKIAR
jgi:hypothetical protein